MACNCAVVASVPVVGNVISVSPEVLKIMGEEPIVVKLPPVKTLPPNVIVLVPLLIPVPPLDAESAVVKLKLPAVSEVPITPVPLILKLALDCSVVELAIYEPLPAGKSAAVKALKLGAPADDPVAGPANIKFCVAVAAQIGRAHV